MWRGSGKVLKFTLRSLHIHSKQQLFELNEIKRLKWTIVCHSNPLHHIYSESIFPNTKPSSQCLLWQRLFLHDIRLFPLPVLAELTGAREGSGSHTGEGRVSTALTSNTSGPGWHRDETLMSQTEKRNFNLTGPTVTKCKNQSAAHAKHNYLYWWRGKMFTVKSYI